MEVSGVKLVSATKVLTDANNRIVLKVRKQENNEINVHSFDGEGERGISLTILNVSREGADSFAQFAESMIGMGVHSALMELWDSIPGE